MLYRKSCAKWPFLITAVPCCVAVYWYEAEFLLSDSIMSLKILTWCQSSDRPVILTLYHELFNVKSHLVAYTRLLYALPFSNAKPDRDFLALLPVSENDSFRRSVDIVSFCVISFECWRDPRELWWLRSSNFFTISSHKRKSTCVHHCHEITAAPKCGAIVSLRGRCYWPSKGVFYLCRLTLSRWS